MKEWETKKPSILFVAQLGDLIDGLCKTRLGRYAGCYSDMLTVSDLANALKSHWRCSKILLVTI